MEMLQYTATLSRQVSKQSKRSACATRDRSLLEQWNGPVSGFSGIVNSSV